jgi:hypothetical protein
METDRDRALCGGAVVDATPGEVSHPNRLEFLMMMRRIFRGYVGSGYWSLKDKEDWGKADWDSLYERVRGEVEQQNVVSFRCVIGEPVSAPSNSPDPAEVAPEDARQTRK